MLPTVARYPRHPPLYAIHESTSPTPPTIARHTPKQGTRASTLTMQARHSRHPP